MPALKTPQEVIQAVGLAGLPDYYDVTPLTDSTGFSVKRRYPPGSPPALVVTGNGAQNNACLIHFAVEPPETPNGVSRVFGAARLYEHWGETHRQGRYNFADPDCPTEGTVNAFKRASKPQEVSLTAEFFYDCADGKFYGPQGELTGHQILDLLYRAHCGTLGWWARLKSRLSRARRNAVRWLVWRWQDACLWLLEHGYDIKPTEHRGSPFSVPFRIYKWSDFVRSSDTVGTHFFGFQSSKRSLFSNLIVLSIACIGAYWLLPHSGLFRVIYMNTALTTVALVFSFLLVDQLVPRALQLVVWILCRLRLKTLFF